MVHAACRSTDAVKHANCMYVVPAAIVCMLDIWPFRRNGDPRCSKRAGDPQREADPPHLAEEHSDKRGVTQLTTTWRSKMERWMALLRVRRQTSG